jgi:dolichol-phosphate mannosyltransferase
MDVSIILPAYCERENICQLIEAVEKSLIPDRWKVEILVVDDNSPDGTAMEVEKYTPRLGNQLTCMVRTGERGLATAILFGIRHSKADRIVVMDTDFNHSPANLPDLVRNLDRFDLVIGSRFIRGGGMEDRKRYLYSLAYNLFIQFILGQSVNDNLSGFFAIRRSVLFSMDLDSIFRGYGEYFIRLTYLARKRGFLICELPVFYTLRQHGISKSKFSSMIRDYTICALKLRFDQQR